MNLKSHLLRLLKLAYVAAFVCPQVRGEEEYIGKLLDQAIEREVAKLQPNSLKLPAPKDGIKPPALIESAGKDFVAAWQDWSVVTATTEQIDENKADLPDATQRINVYVDSKPFIDFLKLCINAKPPPDLAGLKRFFYDPTDLGPFVCGNIYDEFNILSTQGRMLLLLRHGEFLQALRESMDRAYLHKEDLLKAFGVDPEKIDVGRWLNQEIHPEDLCQKGGDLTARMMMDWIDFRWSVELERHKKTVLTKQQESYKEPRISYIWLKNFLRPDSGVGEETKARIVKFIGTRGLEMIPLGEWLAYCPKGSEKWFVPLAKAGLAHPLNQTRKSSSRILTVAGFEHQEPAMTPDPRFRVLVNGKSWADVFNGVLENDFGLNLAFDLANGERDVARLTFHPPDTFVVDADEVQKRDPSAKLHLITCPISSSQSGYSPNQPWLCAGIPLPLDFRKVNQVDIQTVEFTIRPNFPRRTTELFDGIYQVEFGRADGNSGWFVVYSGDSLVLPRISPGEYSIRICHPGAALDPKQQFTISKAASMYEPSMKPASSLVVPVEWPEAFKSETLPFELSRLRAGSRADLHDSLRSLIHLKRRDGEMLTDFGRTPVAANWRFPNSAIFPYLPPGEYEIESPDRTLEPEGKYPGGVIRKTSLKVEIREDSPVFVVTKPLKIDFSRKD